MGGALVVEVLVVAVVEVVVVTVVTLEVAVRDDPHPVARHANTPRKNRRSHMTSSSGGGPSILGP
jgi:hypothetical protein